MIYRNTLKAVNDPTLTAEQKLELIAENLSFVSTEIELHQNELYFIKKGIIAKSFSYYKSANPLIKLNLIKAFQEMEWALIVDDISSFCNAIYRHLEIFSNFLLFDYLKLNDNLLYDHKKTKFVAGTNHYINKLEGCFVNDSYKKEEKFIDFTGDLETKLKNFDNFYLKAESRKGTNGESEGYLRISFDNKLNLIFGLFMNSEIKCEQKNKKYKYIYNFNYVLTKMVSEIRNAKEHGLKSDNIDQWEAKHYYDSIKLIHEIYYGIKELRI